MERRLGRVLLTRLDAVAHIPAVRGWRDQRPYNTSYYRRNRQREIDRVMTRQRVTLEFLRELRNVPCMDCGERFEPHQMDFDHRDPATKLFQITDSEAMLMRRDRLLAEIAKCDVVCSNCHAARTYTLQAARKALRRETGTLVSTPRRARQRDREATRRELITSLKDRPCLDCVRCFPPYVMQFDHRDPTQKKFVLSSSWLKATTTIVAEAAKCDIVCSNCHRHRTFRRRSQAGVL